METKICLNVSTERANNFLHFKGKIVYEVLDGMVHIYIKWHHKEIGNFGEEKSFQ